MWPEIRSFRVPTAYCLIFPALSQLPVLLPANTLISVFQPAQLASLEQTQSHHHCVALLLVSDSSFPVCSFLDGYKFCLASVCNQPMQSGDSNCGIQINSQRFYYNPTSQSCQPFTFNGCNGNFNNFLQLQDCQSLCGTTIQPSKAVVFIPRMIFSSNQDIFIAIPTPVIIQPQCPSGSFPYLSGFGQTQSCTPGIVNTCNTGYVCQLASTSTFGFPSYICCSTTNFPLSLSAFVTNVWVERFSHLITVLAGYCSQGSNPYVTGTTVPQSCIPSAACPTGFTCQYSYSLRQYYCCSQPFTSVLTGQSNTGAFCLNCLDCIRFICNQIFNISFWMSLWHCIFVQWHTAKMYSWSVRHLSYLSREIQLHIFIRQQAEPMLLGRICFIQAVDRYYSNVWPLFQLQGEMHLLGSQSLISSSNSTVKNTWGTKISGGPYGNRIFLF